MTVIEKTKPIPSKKPKPLNAPANAAPPQPGPEPSAQRISRGRRSRENTRQKLIDAALRVMGKKGVDATTISDITDAADVGIGSFYNHFSSKSEIVECVFTLRLEEMGVVVDAISSRESDPAVAITYIHKMFYERAASDTVWAWFVVHVANSTPFWDRGFMSRASEDVARGAKEGRFVFSSVEAAARICMSTVLSTMRSILEGTVTPKVANEIVESTLCMLGVPKDDARTLSQRKLPKYIMTLFDNFQKS